MNFTVLAWLDTYELACSLRPRMHLFPAPDNEGRRILNIRWPDDPEAEAPVWKAHKETRKWTELSNTLGRIMRMGKIAFPNAEMQRGRVFFEMLDPTAALTWQLDTSSSAMRYVRLHLPIRSNPACMMYAGVEAMNPLPGQLVWVKNAMQSAVNLSDKRDGSPRVHLVIDIRAKEAEA